MTLGLYSGIAVLRSSVAALYFRTMRVHRRSMAPYQLTAAGLAESIRVHDCKAGGRSSIPRGRSNTQSKITKKRMYYLFPADR